MNLTRHILATLAMAVAFGAAAIAGDNTLLDVYQSSKEVRKSFKTGKDWFPLPSYYDRAGWANASRKGLGLPCQARRTIPWLSMEGNTGDRIP